MLELPSVKGSTGYSWMQKCLSALWLTAERVRWKLSHWHARTDPYSNRHFICWVHLVEAVYGTLMIQRPPLSKCPPLRNHSGRRTESKSVIYNHLRRGELIRDAIVNGCRNFIVGIGGSATNDGGIGMLQALGYEFRDNNGQPVPFEPTVCQRLQQSTTHMFSRTSKIVTLRSPAM